MNALKSFKHILHVFILWKTHFKRLCNGRTDRPTDGQTEKWLIESRSTRLKTSVLGPSEPLHSIPLGLVNLVIRPDKPWYL